MRKKLFGQNIKPACNYCFFSMIMNNNFVCTKGKMIVNEKCRGFKYDPLMRVPTYISLGSKYTMDDFKL